MSDISRGSATSSRKGMPRSILTKRRTMKDPGQIATLDHHSAIEALPVAQSPFNLISHLASRATDSDEEQLPSPVSEDSCDSGRDSAVPGEISHSASFDSNSRPLHLSLGSSSESLLVKSPLSPFPPLGHISLLPGILQSLAVSGNQRQQEITTRQHHLSTRPVTSSQVRQLAQPPCYSEAAVQSSRECPLTTGEQLHADELQDSASSVSFPSPASRKRSNSNSFNSGNTTATNNGTNAVTAPIRPIPKQRKVKSTQKSQPNDINTSPISGTFIRGLSESTTTSNSENDVIVIRRGDLDKSLNVVEITEEARAGLADIVNKIGPYLCKLCKLTFTDAFGLAGHNCSRIIHIEYQCPECGKSFHCPANLASHRRWHKPRPAASAKQLSAPAAPPTGNIPKSGSVQTPVIQAVPSDIQTTTLKEEIAFVQKSEHANIPFKKRFLFQRSEEKEHVRTLTVESGTPAVILPPQSYLPQFNQTVEKLTNSPILLHEFQQHRCQICGTVVRGAQLFARHWQNCLVTAANRNWSTLFYPTQSP